jgi:hypothetical protein
MHIFGFTALAKFVCSFMLQLVERGHNSKDVFKLHQDLLEVQIRMISENDFLKDPVILFTNICEKSVANCKNDH